MKAYVVVEGMTDVVILRAILPADLLEEVSLEAAGERASLASIARSLLIARRKPVAVLVHTDSVEDRVIRERRQTTQELLKAVAAGTPTKIILLIPSIEIVFFVADSRLAGRNGKTLPEPVRLLARSNPKDALEYLFTQPGGPKSIKDLLESLDEEWIAELRTAAPIRELITFLEGVVKPQAKQTMI